MRATSDSLRVGIDVGGTKVAAGIVDSATVLVKRNRRTSRPEVPAAEMMLGIVDQIKELWPGRGTPPGGQRPVAIGMGFPGALDADERIKSAPNLPAFVGQNLERLFGDAFRQRFGLEPPPVTVGNDACVASLAEALMGAGRGAGRLLYMTVSTGVGGARFDGVDAVNIEPGLSLYPDPTRPDVTLENLASGPAIVREACREIRTLLDQSRDEVSALLEQIESPGASLEQRIENLTARSLGLAAARGHEFCLKLFRHAADFVAVGLTQLLQEGFGEELIIVGGSVAEHVPGFIDRVRWKLGQQLLGIRAPAASRTVDVVCAELGEERGILGAVLLTMPNRRLGSVEAVL